MKFSPGTWPCHRLHLQERGIGSPSSQTYKQSVNSTPIQIAAFIIALTSDTIVTIIWTLTPVLVVWGASQQEISMRRKFESRPPANAATPTDGMTGETAMPGR